MRKRNAFSLAHLEYAPNGFSCDTERGRGFCRKPAHVAFVEDPQFPDDHTYKCADDAPGVPDQFCVYDVFFDWNPRDASKGERRVVSVVARGACEALLLYQAFVDRSDLADAPVRTTINGEDWNEDVLLVRTDATEDDFLDTVRAAVRGNAQLRPYFTDLLDRGGNAD